MKRIGVLFAIPCLCAAMAWAQDNSSSTASDNPSARKADTKAAHKAAAQSDENAAAEAKDKAKDAGTKAGAEKEKAIARLDQSGAVLHELLATPDKGIPGEVMDNAKCVAVVPSMVKGGFIFGAEHGRGVATCRTGNGWSAPAFFTMTGGSWGAQIGGQATDVVMLIMNDNGMNQLLNSKFKVGGTVSGAAGPVGREAAASTDWKMKSEVLTYSRARGAFIGATLNGTAIHQDQNATTAYYGHEEGFRPILTGQVKAPASADKFIASVRQAHAEATAKARD